MFSDEITKYSWDDITARIAAKRPVDVENALSKQVCDIEDFMALISPAAAPYLEPMAALSRKYTQERFGKVISMYIPLYITNSCTNFCVYCGFNHNNPIARVILTPEEIENELFALGALHVRTKRSKTDKPLPPLRYEVNGFTVLKGKNNNQNDTVTFKVAKSDDIWLHVKNAPSAHTVILTDGSQPDEMTIKTACEIAASDFTATATVDYTLRKNVKRKPPDRPGQVYYTDFSSLTVEPNAHEELKVK